MKKVVFADLRVTRPFNNVNGTLISISLSIEKLRAEMRDYKCFELLKVGHVKFFVENTKH